MASAAPATEEEIVSSVEVSILEATSFAESLIFLIS